MDHIQALYEARDSAKSEKSHAAKQKADLETQVALELRDAAMRGTVPRETLTDVTSIDVTSIREKQAQRHK